MAYDDTTFRRQSDEQGGGLPTGYRPGYSAPGYSAPDYRSRRRDLDPGDGGRHAEQPAEPAEPAAVRPRHSAADGADRLGVHLGWEIVLLLAVAALGYLLYRHDPASLRRPALDALLVSATAIGLLALGAGLTLRAGVPNLALGPIALSAALQFAEHGDRGLLKAALPAVVIAAVGGLVAGVLILALHVPGWAATLGAALGVIVYAQLPTAPVAVRGTFNPFGHAFYLFGGFALLALLGGVIGLFWPVRRWLGRRRPVGDPAERRGAAVILPVLGALILSSVFAVLAGVLIAAQSTGPIAPGTGLEWTGIALGTALLAGTSAYGRRGGIFGTVLAAAGMALFLDYANRRGFDIALFAVAGAAVGGGLLVTWLVETLGKPRSRLVPEEEWTGAAAAGNDNWQPDRPETWAESPPAQPGAERWEAGPWGGTR